MTSPTELIVLCPVCGERLKVEEKPNTTGDMVARRACSVNGDYADPWQHRPVQKTANDGARGFGAGRYTTAASSPRMAPLPSRALPTPPKVV